MRVLHAPSETLKRLFRFPSGSILSLVIAKLTEHDRAASRSWKIKNERKQLCCCLNKMQMMFPKKKKKRIINCFQYPANNSNAATKCLYHVLQIWPQFSYSPKFCISQHHTPKRHSYLGEGTVYLIHNKFIITFVLLFFVFYFWCLRKLNKKCLHKLKMCTQVSELYNKLPNIFVHKNSVSLCAEQRTLHITTTICFICWHTQQCIQVHGLWNQNNRRTTTSY